MPFCSFPTHPPTHSLTHSPTHPLTHSPTHPLTHSLTHSLRYTVVAVEQTANSKALTEYVFESKTLLVVGNEQNGIDAEV